MNGGVTKTLARRVIVVGAALTLISLPMPASAATGLDDLVGARAPQGESQMTSRGYHRVNSMNEDTRYWTYWWNPDAKRCVAVATSEARFESLQDTDAADCGQSAATESSNVGTAVAAGAVALGIAALIGGIAVAAHKSHHHDDDRKHYDDPKKEAEFERGYRDGLYNHSYHNYNRSNEYSDGYNKGTGDRERESSYRSRDGRHSGYHQYVNTSELVGKREGGAERDLRGWGFSNIGSGERRRNRYTTWWNDKSHQCVHVFARDGRVSRVDNVSGRTCR